MRVLSRGKEEKTDFLMNYSSTVTDVFGLWDANAGAMSKTALRTKTAA